MKTNRNFAAVALSVVLVLACTTGWGAIYTGSLLYEDSGATNTGLDVAGNLDGWLLFTEISWLIDTDHPDAPPTHPVYYEYTVTLQKYELSHLILELSGDFGSDNIAQVKVNGEDHLLYSITTHNSGPGNPRMPEDLFGIKFDDLGGGFDAGGQLVVHVMSFFSDRLPVWGDAYLKCGGFGNNAFNEGFTPNDFDPVDPPANGSLQGHLLVPNSAIPEPATIGLLAMGAITLLRRRRS